jgi:hypothetical protein
MYQKRLQLLKLAVKGGSASRNNTASKMLCYSITINNKMGNIPEFQHSINALVDLSMNNKMGQHAGMTQRTYLKHLEN